MHGYVATLTTPPFTFLAAGASADEACDAMRRAWEAHAALTGARWSFAELADSVQVLAVHPGATFRDGAPFLT